MRSNDISCSHGILSTFDLSQALSLIILSITVFITIFSKWKRNKPKTSVRTIDDIPHVSHFPFWVPSLVDSLASVYFVIKGGIQIWEKWIDSTNQARIFTLSDYTFSRSKLVVVNSPDLIHKILNSEDPTILHKPTLYNTTANELLKDGLVCSPVHIWEPHRKILNQILTNYKNLPNLFKVINKYCLEMVIRLDGKIVGGNRLCPVLHDNFMKIALDISLGPGTVKKYGIQEASNYCCKVRSIVRYRLGHPQSFISPLWLLNPKKKEYDECIDYFKGYVSKGILRVKENLKDKRELSSSCAEHLLRHEISESEIQAEVSTLLAVAHETIEPAAHFLLQLLAEHPEIQEKCRDEIDSLYNSKTNEMTMYDLLSLKYLECCVLESLRLRAAIPIIGREMGQDIELDGIKIEKGTLLVINTWLLHRNPDIYPEPEKYNPDRFLPEHVKKRHHFAYLPFSSGPRNCIGSKIALMTLQTTAALLLRRFRIKTRDKFVDMKLLYDVTLAPERKFDVFLEQI